MARMARLMTAEDEQPISARDLATRAGCTIEKVYRAMRASQVIAGKQWRFMTDDEMIAMGCTAPGKVVAGGDRKSFVCDCPECNGRRWSPGEIQRIRPEYANREITHEVILQVNFETGHRLLPEEKVSKPAPGGGTWRRNGEVPTCGQMMQYTSPRVYATDPAAYEVLPINPLGPGGCR